MIIFLAPSLGLYQPYLIHTLSIEVSIKFHQLVKTKLGLSARPRIGLASTCAGRGIWAGETGPATGPGRKQGEKEK
jgi:hypothetical protein